LTVKVEFPSDLPAWPKARIKGNRLQHLSQSDEVGLKNAANNSDKILDLLVDPRKNSEKVSITTLVLGQIQSGKTSSLIAAIAGAIDTGFPLIFLLGGTKGNLFDQTFADVKGKLKTELDIFGEKYWANFETISNNPIFNNPDKFRSRIKEAHRWFNEESYASSKIDSRPTIIAGLKEWRNLDKLIDALTPHMDLIAEMPILIIDDEADEVGINTAKKDNERTSNNLRLNKLRNLLPWQSYLAYTATPQANMVTDLDDVLSPDRVVVLKSGEAYVGVTTLFPSCLDRSKGLINWYAQDIPEDELAEARDSKNDSGPIRSFRKALSDFVVRLEVAKSKSFNLRNGQMLINPHANTDPHNQYVNWVNEVLGNWQKNCENNEFEELWESFFKTSYEDVIQNMKTLQTEIDLPNEKEIKTAVFNRVKDKTNFDIQKINATKEGVNLDTNVVALIAVGGNILGRGLQFPNLLVTFMPRSVGTGTTDTIQQRGRFFGYRKKYISLLKGWFDRETRELYEGYSEFEPIFRKAMEDCEKNNVSPKEWRRNFKIPPGSKLTRDAAIRLQTSRLRNNISLVDQSSLFNKEINSQNKKIFNSLIEEINLEWQNSTVCPVSRLRDHAWSESVCARPKKAKPTLDELTASKKKNLLNRDGIYIYSSSIDKVVSIIDKWSFSGTDRKNIDAHMDHLYYLNEIDEAEKEKLGLFDLPIIFMRGQIDNHEFKQHSVLDEKRMPSADEMLEFEAGLIKNTGDFRIGGGLLSNTDREWILNCPISIRFYSVNVGYQDNSLFDSDVPAMLLEAAHFKNQALIDV